MRFSAISFIMSVFLAPAFAQTDRGTLTGAVTDPAGAVVANAAIELRSQETGAVYPAASTATGNYTLSQLPPGTYELAITVPGFKKFIRQNILVQVTQTLRLDIALEVGAATESVTVTEEVSLLKTESGELSHNIGVQRLNSLPVLGIGTFAAGTFGIRNPLASAQLIPGTVFVGNADFRVNGAPSNTQSLRIEGQDASNGNLASSSRTAQSVDSIQEVSIQTSNYAAEYGQAGGGVVNYTMKSGGNQYHGSVYDYWVNEALNAGTPFTDDGNGHLLRPRNRRNDWGFTLGGPVRIPKVYNGTDKTFFFFNWERFKEAINYNNTPITVPTLAYRDGDFRQALTGRALCPANNLNCDPIGRPILEGVIYDPTTSRLSPNGQRIRDPYPNNTIPKAQFDPVSLKIQALIPNPVGNAVIQNLIPAYLGERLTIIPAFKIDHSLSAKDKLSYYWSLTVSDSLYNPVNGQSEGLPPTITAARGSFTDTIVQRLNYDRTITPTLLLHLGAGYQDVYFTDDSPTLNFDAAKELGLRGGSVIRQFPQLTGLSAARGGMTNLGPNGQNPIVHDKPTGNASLTWVRSNHTYKLGGEFRTEGYWSNSFTNAAGLFNFSATETGLPSTQGQALSGGVPGFPYASFLLGRVGNGDITTPATSRIGKQQWGLFIQDTWKATRKLTVDYGLRWDYSTYLREQYGRLPNLSSTTPNPAAGGQPGAVIFEGSGPGQCNCNFASNYPLAIGPRLGTAYQINTKTVLRAGFGVTFNGTSVGGGSANLAASRNPYSSPSFGDPATTLAAGIPIKAVWPVLSPGVYPIPGTLNGPPVVIDQNSGRPSRQMMWSISLQRELMRNMVVEASYVGNRGAWWQANTLVNYNALTPERIRAAGLDINNAADRTLLNSQVNSSTAASRGFGRAPYTGFPTASTVAQALRPYPQFSTGLAALWAPLGNTWYDSLQVKATKRLSYGLDFTYVFTWQKELTSGAEGDGSASVAPSVNDVFNRAQNKYLSGYSRPLTSVLAANYTLPAWGSNKILSYAVKDWSLGAVLQYSSGQPIRVPVAQNALNNLLFRPTVANRVAGEPLFTKDLNCGCIDPVKETVLNPKAWADPAAGQFGNSAAYYGDYRYQRRPNESMSLARIFRITEKANIQVRVEFSNIFNRLPLNNPDSTNALQSLTKDSAQRIVSGFGRINTASLLTAGSPQPRNGTAVLRFTF